MSAADLLPGESLVEVRLTPVVTPRLRVVFVTNMWPDRIRPHYGPFVASQARSLEARGIGIDVLSIRGYASSRAYLLARRRLDDLLSAGAPDLIHVHTGHAAAVSLFGISHPKVISFVGGDLLGHPNGHGVTTKSRVEATAFRRLGHFADATITKSLAMQAVLPRGLQERNFVIPNGVDLDVFKPRDRSAARQALGWKQSDRVALFMGDPNDPRKNVKLAQTTVEKLQDRGFPLRLHIGWGTPPETVPILMAAADALLLPSLSEGSPNVVKEAMACELPIVATPVGDVRERFSGADGCFVVDPLPDEFAAALESALNVPRSAGARRAVGDLALDTVAGRIEQVYAAALRRRLDSQGGANAHLVARNLPKAPRVLRDRSARARRGPVMALSPRDLTIQGLAVAGQKAGPRPARLLNGAANFIESGRRLRTQGIAIPRPLRTRFDVFEVAIAVAASSARPLYLEFGVWKGETLAFWSARLNNPQARFVGFDSFEGLPEDWTAHARQGSFSLDGNTPTLPDSRVSLCKGWFSETLPSFTLPEHDRRIVNVDCDLYSSARTVLDAVGHTLTLGDLLYFDEFHDRHHEGRAFAEFCSDTGFTFELLATTPGLVNVLFRRTG